MAATAAKPWQESIVEQLGTAVLEVDAPDATHCAVFIPADADEAPVLIGRVESDMAGVVLGEDWRSTHPADGEVQVVRLDSLYRWHRAHDAGEPEPEIDSATVEPRRENVDDPDETIEVDVDDETDDADGDRETPAADASGQTQVFDASDYDREDLQIPKVDGESIDKIAVEFKGRVLLDRSDPADVAMYNRMRLGTEVELRVAGKVSSVGTGFTTNRDGDLDVVVGKKGLHVESVWVLTPEQLG